MKSGMIKGLMGLITLCAGLFCSTAYAQKPLMEQDYPDDFAIKVNRAVEMSKKDISKAVQMFLDIYADYPNPVIDYNIARVYQRVGYCEGAKAFYLRVQNTKLRDDDAVLVNAKQAYKEIESCESWQKFRMLCNLPYDYSIVIDGVPIKTCWERPISLKDGEHTIKLLSENGSESSSEKITAKSGERERVMKFDFDANSKEKSKKKNNK